MNSMTGYGRGEATNGDVTVVVEIRTVNNRYRDINLRLPREYLVLEPRFQKSIKERLQRGRVDVFVRRNATDSGQGVHPDPILADRVLAAMKVVAKHLQRSDEEIPLSLVLAHPGVLSPIEADTDALSEWNLVETALAACLDDLCSMRETEGEALRQDLQSHLDEMQRLWAEVTQHTDGIAERLRVRLEARMAHLLADRVDANRLAQEAALLADKADVSEELARIRSHVKQFSTALGATDPTGRRLEFLVQELNREINTIGSKAAEHPVSARVVEMKSVLERLREQSANVE